MVGLIIEVTYGNVCVYHINEWRATPYIDTNMYIKIYLYK